MHPVATFFVCVTAIIGLELAVWAIIAAIN